MVPAFILLVGMFFFPRSPRWLASKDRWEEAIQVLARLHGRGDVNHPKVLAEYREIEEALRFEREQAATSFKALTQPRILKRVILGMSIQMWSQLCGMNIMVSWSHADNRPRQFPVYVLKILPDVLHRLHHEGRWHRQRTLDCVDSVYHQRGNDTSGNPLARPHWQASCSSPWFLRHDVVALNQWRRSGRVRTAQVW